MAFYNVFSDIIYLFISVMLGLNCILSVLVRLLLACFWLVQGYSQWIICALFWINQWTPWSHNLYLYGQWASHIDFIIETRLHYSIVYYVCYLWKCWSMVACMMCVYILSVGSQSALCHFHANHSRLFTSSYILPTKNTFTPVHLYCLLVTSL